MQAGDTPCMDSCSFRQMTLFSRRCAPADKLRLQTTTEQPTTCHPSQDALDWCRISSYNVCKRWVLQAVRRLFPGPLRLEAKDTALSRRQRGFESPRGRQDVKAWSSVHPADRALHALCVWFTCRLCRTFAVRGRKTRDALGGTG